MCHAQAVVYDKMTYRGPFQAEPFFDSTILRFCELIYKD